MPSEGYLQYVLTKSAPAATSLKVPLLPASWCRLLQIVFITLVIKYQEHLCWLMLTEKRHPWKLSEVVIFINW